MSHAKKTNHKIFYDTVNSLKDWQISDYKDGQKFRNMSQCEF